MKYREKLGYMILGGMIGVFGLAVGLCVSPLQGSPEMPDAEFETITCRKIMVVDSDGKNTVTLVPGNISLNSSEGSFAYMLVDGAKAWLQLHGGNADGHLEIMSFESGGYISISGREGRVIMDLMPGYPGGFFVDDGGKTRVEMTGDNDGGRITVYDRDGERRGYVGVNDYGGRVVMFGNGLNNARAILGVNKNGDGIASTWDKNGYHLETLK